MKRRTCRPLDDEERAAILKHLETHSVKATAKHFNRATSTVRDIRYKSRPGGAVAKKGQKSKCEYLPTPEQIALDCAEIQAGWKAQPAKPYELPVYGSICGAKKSRIFERVG